MKHTDVVEVSPPQPMSRRDIERNAWAEAVRLYRPTNVILSPPPSVDIHGLYILIAETNAQWAPKELLDDPDACMHNWRMVHLGRKSGMLLASRTFTAALQYVLHLQIQCFELFLCSSYLTLCIRYLIFVCSTLYVV